MFKKVDFSLKGDVMPSTARESGFGQQSGVTAAVPGPAPARTESTVIKVAGGSAYGESHDTWLVTGYDAVREVLASPDVSNASPDGTGVGGGQPGVLVSMDPPDHTRVRRLLTREFTVKRIQAMQPRLEAVIATQLDEMEQVGAPADLIQHFALPIASSAIWDILGMPSREQAELRRIGEVVFDLTLPGEHRVKGYQEGLGYIAGLLSDRRLNPGNDILSKLVHEHSDAVTGEEMIGVGCFLLIGGFEATAHSLGLGTLLLLRHPDQLAALRRNEGDVRRTTVEEVLRHQSLIHHATPRRAAQEMIVGGQKIKSGDVLVPALVDSNHDPNFLPDAAEFKVERPATRHLAFGHGIHQCLAQQFARTVLRTAFPALFSRFPGLQLGVPERDIRYRSGGFVGGVASLPVRW